MNRASLIPIIFIFAVMAIFILFLALALSSAANFGGLIMIGPIPIAFGSTAEFTAIAMIIGLLLIIVYFFFLFWFQRGIREREMQMRIELEQIAEPERRTEIKGGGVVMIGPIPIIFGSDVRHASLAIALAIILVLLVLVLMFAGVLFLAF